MPQKRQLLICVLQVIRYSKKVLDLVGPTIGWSMLSWVFLTLNVLLGDVFVKGLVQKNRFDEHIWKDWWMLLWINVDVDVGKKRAGMLVSIVSVFVCKGVTCKWINVYFFLYFTLYLCVYVNVLWWEKRFILLAMWSHSSFAHLPLELILRATSMTF